MLVEERLHLMWQQDRETNTGMCRWDAIIPRLLLCSAAPRLDEYSFWTWSEFCSLCYQQARSPRLVNQQYHV